MTNPIHHHEPKSVFLIGMMASGKTTVGRALAERLGWEFIDADRELERRCGVPISFIFEKEGEAGFRARETQLLIELTLREGIVLSTGGGAPMFEINRKLLARGLVIQLATTVSDILERTRCDTTRPLLAGSDKVARVRQLLLERGPVYDALCNHRVITTRQHPSAVVEKILAIEDVGATVARGNAALEHLQASQTDFQNHP